jgi:hypothetical protein
MPCNDCFKDGVESCAYSICPSFKLDDFTQFFWYTSLYSPFNSTILKTNEPPLDGQLPSLRANHLEAVRELAKVNQKIQSIQSLLSDAISHRARLQKVVDDYSSVISPVRRLPFEIVRIVLENTIQTIDHGSTALVKNTPDCYVEIYRGPWVSSKVCQLWREVAMQSSELWCDIQMHFAPNMNCENRSSGFCALLDEGIRRSATRGL